MSDEQERRIKELERHVERLFGVSTTTGERIAVLEARTESIASSVEKSQAQTNSQLRMMNDDIKKSLAETQANAHRRTTILVTVMLGVITTAVQFGVAFIK